MQKDVRTKTKTKDAAIIENKYPKRESDTITLEGIFSSVKTDLEPQMEVKHVLSSLGVDVADSAVSRIPGITEEPERTVETISPDEAVHAVESLEHAAIEAPVALYLREINRVPLLTAPEEVALTKDLERGKKAAIRLAQDEIPSILRPRLETEVSRGVEARKKLMEANLRLVVSVAKRYVGQGLPFLDLIQEGNIGLSRAVDKYDYRKGFRFSTYAHWWIRQAITRSLAEQSRTIRVPEHMIDMISNLYKTSRNMQQDMGREPTVEELAKVMGVTVARIEQIKRAARQPISLATPIGEEEESTLSDFIVDHEAISPAELAARELLKDQLKVALSELTDRERKVLELRFGLGNGHARTLEEVGHELGVTRERARQIERQALAKLREMTATHKLRDYLD